MVLCSIGGLGSWVWTPKLYRGGPGHAGQCVKLAFMSMVCFHFLELFTPTLTLCLYLAYFRCRPMPILSPDDSSNLTLVWLAY